MLAFGGFRRGGSSIGFMILQHLLLESGLSCTDHVQEMWNRGVTLLTGRHVLPPLREHDMVGCFRSAPAMSPKSLAQARLFLLVRDPRDCQVSWYHARHLHQPEGAESVIDDQATIHEDLIREESFDADVTSLLDWCELSGGRVFRYEDMVMNPLAFIMDFAEFGGLPLKRHAIDLALLQASFFQPALDQTNHNRSGVPYEALRTLPAPQLQKLNKRFAPLLARLGYPLDPGTLPEIDPAPMVQRDATKRYIRSLAEQNALRMAETAELKKAVVAVQSESERHFRGLPEQNAMRIAEIAALRQAVAGLRSEIDQHTHSFTGQASQRTREIAELKQSVAAGQSEIEHRFHDLPEQNGLRIVEIAELQLALADVRAEVEQLKWKAGRPVWRKLRDWIFPPK